MLQVYCVKTENQSTTMIKKNSFYEHEHEMYEIRFLPTRGQFCVEMFNILISVIQRVPLVEQERLILVEHLCSPLVLVEFVLLDLCRSLFVLFLLGIVLSVLRITVLITPLVFSNSP